MSSEHPKNPSPEHVPQEKTTHIPHSPEINKGQPAWARIETLSAQSKFRRDQKDSPNTKITNQEGKEFFIKTVEQGSDPALDDVQKLFEDTFSKEEVDPIETLKNAVDGRTESGAPVDPYRVFPVVNAEGELVATMAGAPLEMFDNDGKPTNEMVYFVGYAVTDPNMRQGGIAKQAYISALMDAVEIANKENKKLSFSIGECTASSEHYWNSLGWKRVYVQKQGSAEYVELPYFQPALDFDEDTGLPAEGAGEVPEHLMIDSFSGSPTKENIKAAYEAFILYNSKYPREEFNSDEAFEAKEAYIKKIIDTFKEFVDQGGDLLLLDATTRETAKQKGLQVTDHYVPEGVDDDANDEKF